MHPFCQRGVVHASLRSTDVDKAQETLKEHIFQVRGAGAQSLAVDMEL